MIKLIIIDILDSLIVFCIWQKDLIKLLKIYQLYTRICWGLPGSASYKICADDLSNNLRSNEILYICLFTNLLQNKQKPIINSCRGKLWSTPILILWNIEFKILRKKPGDKAFLVSFNFPMSGWDQRIADFNTFSNIETRSCYSSLVLYFLT